MHNSHSRAGQSETDNFAVVIGVWPRNTCWLCREFCHAHRTWNQPPRVRRGRLSLCRFPENRRTSQRHSLDRRQHSRPDLVAIRAEVINRESLGGIRQDP
jgi:hypothetical protein